jgi:hypothetical protein
MPPSGTNFHCYFTEGQKKSQIWGFKIYTFHINEIKSRRMRLVSKKNAYEISICVEGIEGDWRFSSTQS